MKSDILMIKEIVKHAIKIAIVVIISIHAVNAMKDQIGMEKIVYVEMDFMKQMNGYVNYAIRIV